MAYLSIFTSLFDVIRLFSLPPNLYILNFMFENLYILNNTHNISRFCLEILHISKLFICIKWTKPLNQGICKQMTHHNNIDLLLLFSHWYSFADHFLLLAYLWPHLSCPTFHTYKHSYFKQINYSSPMEFILSSIDIIQCRTCLKLVTAA